MSSSEADVDRNYRGVGPDLTGRKESETEFLENTIPEDPTMYGLPDDADPVVIRNHAEKMARDKLVGQDEGGRVIEAFVKMNNPVILSRYGRCGTWFDFTPEMDEDGEYVADSPNATLLIDYPSSVEADDLDAPDILTDLMDDNGDFQVSAMALKDAIGKSYATDNSGGRISAELASGAFRALGFDGVIYNDASDHLRGMSIPPGTNHFVVWNGDGSQVKDVSARAFDASNPNLYAASSGGATRGQLVVDRAFKRFLLQVSEANVNDSTLVHELAHLTLELVLDMAENPSAGTEIRKFAADALAFLGVENRSRIESKHHERWAESWEVYLREGKAPSSDLAGAFAYFRSRLLAIYETIRGRLVNADHELTFVPLFDRLLATEQEIRASKAKNDLMSAFADSVTVKDLFPGERDEILSLLREAQGEERARLEKIIAREQDRVLKEQRGKLREKIAEEVYARPEQRLRYWLVKGLLPDGEFLTTQSTGKLSKVDVEALGGDTKRLPRGTWTLNSGLSPATVAAAFGYGSPEEMLDALEMSEKPSEIISPPGSGGGRARPAPGGTEAIGGRGRGGAGLPAGSGRHEESRRDRDPEDRRQAPHGPLPGGRPEDRGRGQAGRSEARASKSWRLRRRQAAGAKVDAQVRRDWVAFEKALEAEQIANSLVEIGSAQVMATKQRRRFLPEFKKPGSKKRARLAKHAFEVDAAGQRVNYLDVIDGLLSAVDFSEISAKRLGYAVSIEGFAQKLMDEKGIEIPLPPWVMDLQATPSFKTMTTEQFADLYRTVRALEKHGLELARDAEAAIAGADQAVIDEGRAALDERSLSIAAMPRRGSRTGQFT